MLDDLKARLAGFDRKRLYTAVAALLVAGAAGHIMQRGSSAEGDTAAIAGSVLAPVPVAAPTAADPAIDGPEIAAAIPPAPLDAVTISAAAPEIATPADQPPIIATAMDVQVVGEQLVADMPTGQEIAQIPATPAKPRPDMTIADASAPEVTRGPTDPVLAMPDQAIAPALETLEMAAQPVVDIPQPLPATDTAEVPVTLAALDDTAVQTDPIDVPAVPGDATAQCDITLTASATPGALVMLTLEAPCQSGGEVTFAHAGLMFSEQLDPDGGLDVIVPAMAERATFVASFDGVEDKSVEISVPDAAEFERIALVWQGATGLQIHALENGASYGEPGHVWAEEPADPARAVEGKGGFVTVLGSTASGYAADIYTYPAALMASGVVEPQVSVEAQVMENTCGNRIDGMILRSDAGRAPSETSLSMAVPACDAVGEFLVLHNLPQDLKIARN